MPKNAWITPDEIPSGVFALRVYLPIDFRMAAAFVGALQLLQSVYEWEQIDGISPEEAAEAWAIANEKTLEWDTLMELGTISIYGSATIPDGWLACDGAEYNQADYPELFALIGQTYGGNPGTFRTPNISGRTVFGTGPRTRTGVPDWVLNNKFGAEAFYWTNRVTPHTHVYDKATSVVLCAPDVAGIPVHAANVPAVTGSTGANIWQDILPPGIALTFMIRCIP